MPDNFPLITLLATNETMKRILRDISIAVVALVVLAFALNSFVRVTHSPARSIGIVEDLLFGRPVERHLRLRGLRTTNAGILPPRPVRPSLICSRGSALKI